MEKFRENKDAVSPVVGVILLVGLTVIMISTIAVSVFAFSIPERAPQARIVVVEVKGDIGHEYLYNNVVVLKHKGGDVLNKNDTKIIITGKGYTYTTGVDPYLSSARDMRVTYRDLTGKNYYHNGTALTSKQIVSGTSWDTGEQIELYGRDGLNFPTFTLGYDNSQKHP